MIKKILAAFCMIFLTTSSLYAQWSRSDGTHAYPGNAFGTSISTEQGATGESDNSSVKPNLYPNPSRGTVYLATNTEFTGKDIFVEIADVSGKVVRNFKVNAQDTRQIDLTGLSDGLYFIKLTVGNKETVKKMVIDRN